MKKEKERIEQEETERSDAVGRVMLCVPVARRNWNELAKAANYNARGLARLCNFSLRHLERVIQRDFGLPLQKWLDKQRLDAAQELLLSGHPVKRVAFELGYKQCSHFCRQFKARNHLTPSQFVIRRTNCSPDVAAR